ncbi:hypothetical protein HQN90_05975 [Paenibacillus alba]|uniref:hypothetical protein n=1 Tax=Paenibacillus alba TaxID=1197127 RepID=UPI001564C927|nr:hypothetical protein [Paenibacillus alba]NQX65671.1 hypothetical protein [Paenibacillus alba]
MYVPVVSTDIEIARADYLDYKATGHSKFFDRYRILNSEMDPANLLGLTKLYPAFAYVLREDLGTLDQEPRLRVYNVLERRFDL